MNPSEHTKPRAKKQSDVTANVIANLDPQLSRFANTALDLMRMQVLQTVAAHKDPANYPMKPRPVHVQNSTKQHGNVSLAVDKWLKAMPADKRAKVLADFNLDAYLSSELKTAMQQAKVDLKLPQPALEQAGLKSHFNFVDATLIETAASSRKFDEATVSSGGAGTRASIGAVSPSTALKFRLHKVKCIDESTDAEWKGTDDIELGGSATDDKTNTTEIPKFFVGEFNDGGEKVYEPAKVLKTFTLSGAYPKTFLVFISIAERDSGGFATFINDLVTSVEDEVDAVISAAAVAAGVAIGGTVGGPVGALLGAVGVALVGGLVALIGHIASDEVWEPQMASVYLGSAGHRFAGGTRVSTTRMWTYEDYSGKYNVHYSWELAQ
jgi:hypothetical protein